MPRRAGSAYLLVDISKLGFAPVDNVLAEPGEGLVELQQKPNLPAKLHSIRDREGLQWRVSIRCS
jgi:hypothetical protein